MKKIAIIVCAWPPLGGGIGNNAYYHALKLSEKEYDVSVFAPWSEKAEKGVDLRLMKTSFAFGKAGFMKNLSEELESFDVLHLYYPFFGSDLLVGKVKKKFPGKKLVLHYEMDPVGKGIKRIVFFLYFKLFLGKMIRISDVIGILSWDHARNSYLKKYIKRFQSKFAEIPNGVDTGLFAPREKNSKLMEKFNLKKNDPVAIFVGCLDKAHYFKGVEVLIRSFEKVLIDVPEAKLLIVGDGDMRGEYEALAEGIPNIIFTGWVKNESLPDYYALSSVFVLPSTERTESFGIVIAEAQACGLPAVASDWPGSRMTLQDNRTGFLAEPGNENDLKQKIVKLLSDPDLRASMGKKGMERARELYCWDKVIEKIIKIYG